MAQEESMRTIERNGESKLKPKCNGLSPKGN